MMRCRYFIAIFLVSSGLLGCKEVVSSQNSRTLQNQPSSVAPDSSSVSLAKDEGGSSGELTPDIVMNEVLIQNGFVVFNEKITSFSDDSLLITVSYISSGFQLFTRIQEHILSTATGMTGLNVSPTKLSTLGLTLAELVVSHADGTSQRLPLTGPNLQFALTSKESVNVAWVVRGSPDSPLCAFYHNVNLNLVMSSFQGNWALLGSSLKGAFIRTIQAQVGSGLRVPLVTAVEVTVNPVAGAGQPAAADIDFGCNGFMQSMN